MPVKLTAPADKALTSFDTLPDAAHVRLPTLCVLLGVSGPTAWRWSKSGKIPQPVKRGGVTAWNVGELRRALAASAA